MIYLNNLIISYDPSHVMFEEIPLNPIWIVNTLKYLALRDHE